MFPAPFSIESRNLRLKYGMIEDCSRHRDNWSDDTSNGKLLGCSEVPDPTKLDTGTWYPGSGDK